MTTTIIDVCNKALVILGQRKVITGLNQDSIEARALNQIYTQTVDWCLSMANWNFARKTQVLTQRRVTNSDPTWSDNLPSPPWSFEYSLPENFIKAIYLTDNTKNTLNTSWLGEPQRFVIASDTISDVEQRVLLTNVDNPAILVYTASISDPTLWPRYFERLVVAGLAWWVCSDIIENIPFEKIKYYDDLTTRCFMIADQNNREEGLIFGDTTPEWIQALGINYPYRRDDGRMPKQIYQRRQNNDDAG